MKRRRSGTKFICEEDGKNPQLINYKDVILVVCEDRPVRYFDGNKLKEWNGDVRSRLFNIKGDG